MDADTLLSLVLPDAKFREQYVAMARASIDAGESGASGYWVAPGFEDFDLFVRRLDEQAHGIGVPPGFVPQTTFWLCRNGREIIGECRLRHALTPSLRIEGGHIGYLIHLNERRKGYGSQLLAMVLPMARERGLRRVLVTCNSDNIASARIIQKNGGQYDGESPSPRSGKPVSRYWIDLP